MTLVIKQTQAAPLEAGASPSKADAAPQAVLGRGVALKADLHKALLIQTGLVAGLSVMLVKLLP